MFVPINIGDAVGEKSKGKPAANKPEDVKKVQGLLRKVFGSSASMMKDGICDPPMKTAIAEFQKVWGGIPDSTVDPVGETLKRLNRLANPLTLKTITLGLVSKGGYIISYQTSDGGILPAAGKGYTLHLGFQNDINIMDVTGKNHTDLLDGNNIGEVLKIIEKIGCWAQTIQCKLYVKYNGGLITASNTQPLNCPVQPHNGKMLPLDESGNGQKLTYQGNPVAKDFHGRMFAKVTGYDKYVFIWAGKFESNPAFRGFDCITYAGTTCGASTSHMAASSDLANSLGGMEVELVKKTKDPKTGAEIQTKVKLDDADSADVNEFFKTNTAGYFLLWSGGHIVIVANGTVHEFKASSPSGYATTQVGKWLDTHKMKLTVRKLSGKPALAV